MNVTDSNQEGRAHDGLVRPFGITAAAQIAAFTGSLAALALGAR